MKNERKNTEEGGFIEIIILILLVLLVMKFFGITISNVYHWFVSFFSSVLR